jgi:predicted DNA-binding transcriptional regulator YafY
VKNEEDLISNNVGNINAAMDSGEQISFKYFDYNIQKRKTYRMKGQLYTVSPYALVYSDENYYMHAYAEEHGEVRPYRVDRMEGVKVLAGVVRQGKEVFDKIDLAQYQKYTFSMFGGKVEPVTMVFQNRMMNAVIDRFGRDLMVMKEDDNHFRITVNVAVSNQFYGWVFGLGNMVRIVGPEHVEQGMKDMLEEVRKRY